MPLFKKDKDGEGKGYRTKSGRWIAPTQKDAKPAPQPQQPVQQPPQQPPQQPAQPQPPSEPPVEDQSKLNETLAQLETRGFHGLLRRIHLLAENNESALGFS